MPPPTPKQFEPIPQQGPGPHFTIDSLGRLSPASPADLDVAGNNLKRLSQMLPLVREAVSNFLERLGVQSNSFPELARDAAQYLDEVSKPQTMIEWGLVWGLGVVLEEAAAAADRAITAQLEPPLEDSAQTALQSWRRLHPVLILATAEGVELQAQSDVNRMTKPERAEVRAAARDLAREVRYDGIATEAAARILQAAVDSPVDGRHPERSVEFMVATVRNASIILVSAAIVAGVAHKLGGEPGVIASMAGWEVAKKSAGFSSALAALGKSVDDLRDGAKNLLRDGLDGLHLYWDFVESRKTKFLRFSKSTGKMLWMDGFINSLGGNEFSPPSQPAEALRSEIVPPDFKDQARSMIIAGHTPPSAWREWLVSLDLRYSKINDLSPVSGLTFLKTLYLDYTHITDLSPLKSLIDLEELSMWRMPAADISPIACCHKIRILYAGLSEVVDWTALQSLSNLEKLYLFNSSIRDLEPIAKLEWLVDLDISNTMVTDLWPIQNLKRLQGLDLSGTHVKSVAPLINLLSLRMLDLSQTKVGDLSALDHLRPRLEIIGAPKRKPRR